MSATSGGAADAWVFDVLGFDVGKAGAGADTAATAMAAWKAARGTAVTTLHALAARVDKLDFPEAPQAVILLRAIAANLTAEPVTPQQRAELRNYLENDDIVDEAEEPNGFGIEVELRDPLLAALAGLERAQAA